MPRSLAEGWIVGRKRRSRERIEVRGSGFETRLGAILGAGSCEPDPPPDPSPEPAPTEPATLSLGAAGRVVVRRERKGRRGKTVIFVEGLGLGPDALRRLAKEAARALGCRATPEGEALILGGDHAGRVADWLRSRGVGRVIRG